MNSGGSTSWLMSPGGDTAHGVFEETGDEIWRRLLELNLVGVARVCRAAVPFLRGSDRAPAIVIVSSINAYVALGSEPYSSAKGGARGADEKPRDLPGTGRSPGQRCRAGDDQNQGLAGPRGRSRTDEAVI